VGGEGGDGKHFPLPSLPTLLTTIPRQNNQSPLFFFIFTHISSSDYNQWLLSSYASLFQSKLIFQSLKRPDFGTTGSRIDLITNHYRLKKLPETTIYQYAVSIIISGWKSEDRRIPPRLSRCILASPEVEKALGEAKKGFVYDGTLPIPSYLASSFPTLSLVLPSHSISLYLFPADILGRAMAWSDAKIPDVTVNLTKDRREVLVSFSYATSFNLASIHRFMGGQHGNNIKALEGISFLNHLFAHCPSKTLIPVGRKFFTTDQVKTFAPIEFRRGVFQAVHFGGTESLTVNVDMTTGIFWNSNNVTLADLSMQLLHMPPEDFARGIFTDNQYHYVQRMFRGMKFTVRHLTHLGEAMAKRQHTVTKLYRKSAAEETFEQDGRPISIASYMKKAYNITLRYPKVFMIQKGTKTYIPLELCFVAPVPPPHLALTLISVPTLPISLGRTSSAGNDQVCLLRISLISPLLMSSAPRTESPKFPTSKHNISATTKTRN
jgi:PAZ domain/N-terminal domain of argonaute/Argonaute linker 1 domain